MDLGTKVWSRPACFNFESTDQRLVLNSTSAWPLRTSMANARFVLTTQALSPASAKMHRSRSRMEIVLILQLWLRLSPLATLLPGRTTLSMTSSTVDECALQADIVCDRRCRGGINPSDRELIDGDGNPRQGYTCKCLPGFMEAPNAFRGTSCQEVIEPTPAPVPPSPSS